MLTADDPKIEKRVQISAEQVRQLEALAVAQKMSESAVIEQALNLLYRLQTDEWAREDWDTLKQLEAECGPLPPYRPMAPPDTETLTFVVGTPLAPESIRRWGQGA